MQQVSEQTRRSLEESVSLEIFSRVIMEIELNNYRDFVLDFPESLNDDIFPAESVMISRRPDGGLPKFVAGDAKAVSSEVLEDEVDGLCYPAPGKRKIFYRTPTEESKYKYFRTKERSGANGSFSTPQIMQAIYSSPISLNSFVVGFEYANAIPTEAEIQLLQGESWITIGTYPVSQLGRVEVFYNGSWSDQYSAEYSFTSCEGVRVVVWDTDIPNSALEVIQISPRILLDISDRIIDVNMDKIRETVELTSPVGISTASTAVFTISNNDGFFINDNTESPLFGLIDFNIKFTVRDIVRTEQGEEEIPQMVCFTESWDFDSERTVTVECLDRSKILQSQNIEDCFYVNKDIRVAIADIVERAGVTNYKICYSNQDNIYRIPYLFFENEFTVWQALQELAIAEQAVVYFDESDTLIWESRDYLWEDDFIDVEIRSRADNNLLANLISYNYSHEIVANKATVFYTPTDLARRGDELVNNFLWEDAEQSVLLATPLLNQITNDSLIMLIDEEDYLNFPKEGLLLIDAEYIRYSKDMPEDFDGEDALPNENLNGLPLYIKERGVFSSRIRDHLNEVDESRWIFDSEFKSFFDGEEFFVDYLEGESENGLYEIDRSKLVLDSFKSSEQSLIRFLAREALDGEDGAAEYSIYGCELEFPFTDIFDGTSFVTEQEQIDSFYDGDGIAGMVINAGEDPYQGYYFELMSSLYARKNQEARREVRVWKYDSTGRKNILRGYYPEDVLNIEIEELEEILGADLVVGPGIKYRMNIIQETGQDFDGEGNVSEFVQFVLIINGRRIFGFKDVESENNRIWTSGRWGAFARGNTTVEFEYVYAVDPLGRNVTNSNAQISIRDQINGGYNDFFTEYLCTGKNQSRLDFFFEDFGAWLRGVAEYDVRHEVLPAISSRMFLSNEDEAFVVYHRKNQFSSKFAVANRMRRLTVIAGDDPRQSVTHSLAVYGVPLIQSEMSEVEFTNAKAVWQRGINEISVDSRWINTKVHAERVAGWVVDRWSVPVNIVSAEVVLDPRVQLGDLVSIESPDDKLTAETHKFHVVEIQKTIGDSNTMSLLLRRAYF